MIVLKILFWVLFICLIIAILWSVYMPRIVTVRYNTHTDYFLLFEIYPKDKPLYRKKAIYLFSKSIKQ